MKAFATHIIQRLTQNGHTAFFVGGCVRDELLGLKPHDFDIATSAEPHEVKCLFPKTIEVGESFGVVFVQNDANEVAQVATFRSDIGSTDGRHPDKVIFSSPEQDALRRDFTINGMFQNLDGKVIDFVGGRNDLAKRTIRAIGDPDIRFGEDKLRMIRAIRFASSFDFSIDEETAASIERNAENIKVVSVERIHEELTKILVCGHADRGFRLLDELEVLEHILPEISIMKGVEQPPQFHPEGDVFKHTMGLLAQLEKGCDPMLAWACLLHDVGKPKTFTNIDRIRFNGHDVVGATMTVDTLRRLKFSNDEIELIVNLVRNHMRWFQVEKMNVSTLKKFVWQDRFDLHMRLHQIDCGASHPDSDERIALVREKMAEFGTKRPTQKPFLNGRDLKAMGLKPGPIFATLLRALDDATLEGVVKNRDEAVAFINQKIKEHDV